MVRAICNECKTFTSICAKGLCLNCYQRLKAREYRTQNPEKYISRDVEWRKNHKKEGKKKSIQYYLNHLHECNIRTKDRRILVAFKDLIKYCVVCGSLSDLQLHHFDYTEFRLITFLCNKCHNELHLKNYLNNL